jgi:hypothetical protein
MAIKEDKILAQLKRILESNTFSKTSTSLKLLDYLVRETLKGAEIKELTIGVEMFGKRYDPVKNDNKVRVYIYHLRKKLQQYYSQEAAKDEIVFHIEKGQYRVEFLSEYDEDASFFSSKKGMYWTSVSATVLLFVLIAYFIYFQPNKCTFWNENFTNTFPTTVLIGDHFTINGPIETNSTGVIRDFGINSEQDFQSFLQNHPEKVTQLSPGDYTYITKMGAYCAKDISSFFVRRRVNFDLRLSSEWDKSNINDENIVFIGQAKTMRFFENIFQEQYPMYELDNHRLTRTDPVSGKITSFDDISDRKLVDYTVVAKIKGPEGNCHKFFISDHDGGVISSLKYFTNPDSVSAFYARHKISNEDFIAVFKVSGWERTGYHMNLECIDFYEKK